MWLFFMDRKTRLTVSVCGQEKVTKCHVFRGEKQWLKYLSGANRGSDQNEVLHCRKFSLVYIFIEKRTIKKSHQCDSFLWSGRRDSNSRQSAWKADTLPTELLPHILAKGYCKLYNVDSTLNKTNFQVPYCGNSLVAPSNAGAGASISVVSSGAVCAYSLTLNVDNKIFLSLSYGLTSKSLILM